MGSTAPVKPPALKSGDVLGIVAPASGIKPDMLSQGIHELESLGFKIRVREDIHAVERYLAGSLDRRLDEFREMLLDDQVRGIICARGGYGSGHLLTHLKPEELAGNPKVFCGASDITMLLAAFARAGVVAFHGPMVATTIRQGTTGYDRKLLMDMLVEGEAVRFDTTGCEIVQGGHAQGRLTGGCISLVAATIGTDWEIDATDSILVLEDVDAKPYQLDRMITQLRQAGTLDKVRGFVFGEMLNCDQHPDQGYTVQDLIRSMLGGLNVPILYGFPTGHSSKPNAIVPFGPQAELSLDSETTFHLLESAVTL